MMTANKSGDHAATGPATMRLDRWLWCARFFRTRALAADAVKNGRVLVRGQRAKPASLVRGGDVLCIRQPPFRREVAVLALPAGRASAPAAAALYRESDESSAARRRLVLQLRAERAMAPRPERRPDKRDRRLIVRFRRRPED
jgi:ribosome-associated heat shock protein Hsp15